MNNDLLKEAMYYEQLSPTLIILVLVVAFILGAIHALSPGHGKSLMAAYLIGSRGRIRDAIILALTLTISHVFTVLVVGFLALFLADFFLPETISKWFGLCSGIAILFIGIWLFISRYRVLKKEAKKYFLNNMNNHGLKQHYVDKHIHPKNIQQHSNSVPCKSEHEHHTHTHNHYDLNLSIWSNIALGISGGIIPCPKAIVILLLAISLHKIALGIIIILVFSLGLAFTLVTLGIVVVKASFLLKRRLNDKRLQVISTFSTIIIIGLGIFLTYQSTIIILTQ